jgi:hypothetical protein
MDETHRRLRKWFGPSQKEVWRSLSEQIGAQYVEGGLWRGDKVVASHGEWSLTLDTYVVNAGKTVLVFTRMRAPYVNPDGFRFSVSRAGLFTGIAKRLGMQDVAVGHEDFDREFVIKGNSEEKLRALFASSRLRELIGAQKDIHFSVDHDSGWFKPEPPPDVDTLEFHVTGVIKDIERLKLLFDLFSMTLDELCRIGSAYEGAPDTAAT